MNSLELTEHRILVSMFIDAHRPERRYVTRQDFLTDYHTEADTRLFNSIAMDLRKQGLAKVVPDRGTYAIRLHGDAYKAALSRILDTLKADTFEVDWQTKRILTDADESDHDSLIPCESGWMLLTCERKTSGSAIPTPASSQIAGRDINQFFGPVYGNGVNQPIAGEGESWWSRWGTIFGGLSAILAVAAIIAAWYFWRYPHA